HRHTWRQCQLGRLVGLRHTSYQVINGSRDLAPDRSVWVLNECVYAASDPSWLRDRSPCGPVGRIVAVNERGRLTFEQEYPAPQHHRRPVGQAEPRRDLARGAQRGDRPYPLLGPLALL